MANEPASFWTQANALLRKNLTFQKRNVKTNVRLIMFPFLLCLLLVLLQRLVDSQLDKAENKCGCECVRREGDTCVEEECGIEHSDLDQVTTCAIPNPPEWSPLLQVPAPQYRAVRTDNFPFNDYPNASCRRNGSCPVTMLFTGTNQSFGEIISGNMIPSSFTAINSSAVMASLAANVAGSASYTENTNFLEPAFFSDQPIYYLQSQCTQNSTFSISFELSAAISREQELVCAEGLRLWRNSASEVNNELYRGYRKSNLEEQIQEIAAGYDFLNSNGRMFNVSIWYNSTYKNDTGSTEIALARIPRSVNLVSDAYLQFLLGPGTKMFFEFVKEMPKPSTPIKFDLASLLGGLFFTWVILQLFPKKRLVICGKRPASMKFCLIIRYAHGGWIIVMELYPGFALYRGLYEFSQYSFNGDALGTDGMRWGDLSDSENGMKEVLIIMFVEWILVLSFAYYIDQLLSTGSRKSPLFFFKRFQKKPDSSFRKPSIRRQKSKVFVQMEKPDVTQERERVENLLLEPTINQAIVCDDLRKVYPGRDGNPEKLAMIGLTKPTSGTAFVEGLDIRTHMDGIYTSMGVCPQHDLLWESLTGREHLLFYGRLKNLKGSALTEAVEESLKSVNLFYGGVADKKAGKYSGGMKRRLSVAISLIGDPKVVYMDEPSTGLDPASRNNLWNVVKRAKQDRAIILTTHSMEEAEVLCDRLGIFVDGSLQCIGNPKELKGRYGGTYVFTMTTSVDDEKAVENLVRRLSPNANKIYHISGTQKFELPKEDVKIADVFKAVETAKRSFTVSAWGLADTTLEDVFIKVARAAQPFDTLS
ncbi:ABC transporter A family member 7 [Vigna angularis]|uniref:ABC transporter A family member 7 n=1 Tax=Phaseolus angularis TaxID=3914 RepID=A0A8T0KI53_PHAAN|nr:ABC transporter A family member 7 [Vigna angularis]